MHYSIEDLKSKFKYNPETGEVLLVDGGRWKRTFPVKAISSCGYYRSNVMLNGKKVALLIHRVAYQIYHNVLLESDQVIDHVDHNKLNNRISNLRATTREVNNRNLALRKGNKSGVSGVYQLPGGRWRAQIRIKKINHHIGCYSTLEEAASARRKAIGRYGFHENHS